MSTALTQILYLLSLRLGLQCLRTTAMTSEWQGVRCVLLSVILSSQFLLYFCGVLDMKAQVGLRTKGCT